MYSCGPTVHDRMHIGECRRFVFADLLFRYLQYRDYSVTHVINITDLDDKTIEKSDADNREMSEYTEEYISLFRRDLSKLKIRAIVKITEPDMNHQVDQKGLLIINFA